MMSGLVIIVCAQGELQICWLPAYRISWCKRWVGGNRKPYKIYFRDDRAVAEAAAKGFNKVARSVVW